MINSSTLLYIVLFIASLVSGICLATGTDTEVTAALVVDASPGQNRLELLTAVTNVYKSLRPGDRILLFTVRGNSTRLYASTAKTEDSKDFQDFSAIVNTIEFDWFFQSDLFSALSESIFVHLVKRTALQSPATIFVISESRMTDSQAGKICSLIDQFREKYRWPTIIISSLDSTNRQILAASIQQRLYWLALSEAPNPTAIKDHLDRARGFATNLPRDAPNKPATTKPEQPIQKSVPTETERKPQTLSSPVNITPPKPALSNKQGVPESVVNDPYQVSKKIAVPDGKPIVRTTLPIKTIKKLPSKTWHYLSNNSFFLTAAVGCVVLFSVVCYLVIASWLNARSFSKKLLAPINSQQPSQSKVLMVKVGDATYRIGQLSRINSFHIGRDQANTVMVNKDKVAPRHLRIFRRGKNLFLKNLAKDAVTVNGSQLRARRKRVLSLPAVIEISGGTQIQFLWEKPAQVHLTPLFQGNKDAKANT